MDGRVVNILIDTGCSVSLISANCARGLKIDPVIVRLQTVDCEFVESTGSVLLDKVTIRDGIAVSEVKNVEAHILPRMPLNVDMIIGLDVILKEGLSVSSGGNGAVTLGLGCIGATNSANQDQCDTVSIQCGRELKQEITDDDFSICFDKQKWWLKWRWKDRPPPLNDRRCNYNVPQEQKDAFDQEIQQWIDDGILVPWCKERDGDLKNILPLMSVKQEKGNTTKIRPVLDFRFLNDYVISRPGSATPLCQERLREWRQSSPNFAMVDLKKAYLQIMIDPNLWCYQGVRWKGQTFVLTRLGFGLNIAPKAMTKIVQYVLNDNPRIASSASSYIDDIYVDESKASVDEVIEQLKCFGLMTKPPERINEHEAVRVLGLSVDSNLTWRRDGKLPNNPEDQLTRRQVHKLLGEWMGHYPVAGWLRVACGYLQRLTAKEGIGWDEYVSASVMNKVTEVSKRLKSGEDPVKGKWLVPQDGMVKIWTDASNLALGVAITVDGVIVEDAAWLRKENDSSHINLSELDAAIKGVNLALKWGFRTFTIMTDSVTVKGWLSSVFKDSHNVKTRALSELLIRRRLDMLRELRVQEQLSVEVALVRSGHNLADGLTRVPKLWSLGASSTGNALIGNLSDLELENVVKDIHNRHHLGVDRTLDLVKEVKKDVSRSVVSKVISECDECAKICPTATKYPKGHLSSGRIWKCVSSDITHVGNRSYLTLIDTCSRFCVWRHLANESAQEICDHLNSIFSLLGPPELFLSDNGTVYRSAKVRRLMALWEVKQTFSCAHRPQGNGISERNHRTIKTMVARSKNSVSECVYWYNITANQGRSSPFSLMFHAQPKIPGIRPRRVQDCVQLPDRVVTDVLDNDSRNPFVVGDSVYLRSDGRCDSEWSGPHRVSLILSPVALELDGDGVSRHVSHIRRVPRSGVVQSNVDSDSESDSDESVHYQDTADQFGSQHINVLDDAASDSSDTTSGSTISATRRSSRRRRAPRYFSDYVM